ncbi:hypothetical protein [Aurantimonas sp. VKM B-3413]|uniref:hypothetical protein n=1 Tax=Aurantimonas sp. VKM B-3413 TaxID=2779401 RepID=UPI001E543DE9|nr:hypothetical protein [Aurantimonas sp. VKM B-3413]MCB8837463.1 hypothetical protein [Aurantimonas sp. VKM B-3413]
MSDTKPARDKEIDQPDLADNAIERTDNAFNGKPDGERLIGRDVPIAEQDAEEEENDPLGP